MRKIIDFLQRIELGKFVWAAVAVYAACYVAGAFLLKINADELQLITADWHAVHGARLYADVWDNHGPLLNWVLMGLIKLFNPSGYAFVWVGRALMLGVLAATVYLFWRWAAALDPGQPALAPLSLLFFLISPVLAVKGIEIRGDNPMHLFWVASLGLWFMAARRNSLWLYGCSGLVLGLCFALSIKTLTLGVAAGTMFITLMILERRVIILPMVAYGAGTAVTPVLMALILKAQGLLGAFWQTNFSQNVDREMPGWDHGFEELKDLDELWTYLILLVLLYTGWRVVRRQAPRWVTLVWPCALFLVGQFLFLLPTHYYQSFLTPLGPLAVLTAWAFLDLAGRRGSPLGLGRPVGRWQVLAVALLMIFAVHYLKHQRFYKLDALESIATYDALTEQIEPGALVFDGNGHPLWRANPSRYKSLVNTVRDRYLAGTLDEDFATVLTQNDVPYVVYDKRVADLGPEWLDFLQTHYIPLSHAPLMAAGLVVPSADGATSATVQIAGDYQWDPAQAGPNGVTVDGQHYAIPPVHLADGPHRIEWNGPSPLVLSVAKPARWGLWAAMKEKGLPDKGDYKDEIERIWPGYEP